MSAKTGKLTRPERAVLDLLNGENLVTGGALAAAAGTAGTRGLRKLIWHLRSVHRIPILGWPGKGYSLPRTPEDVRRCTLGFQQMARDFFAIASILQATTVDVVAGQMLLDIFAPAPAAGERRPDEPASPHTKAWQLHLAAGRRRIRIADVLERTLKAMAENREVYGEQLEKLSKTCGTILLPPGEAAKVRKARQLLNEVAGLSPAPSRPRKVRRSPAAAKRPVA